MSGSGWEALTDDREFLGNPPGCPGVVGRPVGCPGVVRSFSRMSKSGRRPYWLSRSGRETLPNVRE